MFMVKFYKWHIYILKIGTIILDIRNLNVVISHSIVIDLGIKWLAEFNMRQKIIP